MDSGSNRSLNRDDVTLLDVHGLAEHLKISERTIWRMAALAAAGQGDGFPVPITIGPRLRRWRLRDVEN